MSHARALWLCLLGLLVTHSASAQQDGPAPIDTTASVSAGADEDIQLAANKPRQGSEHEHAAGTYTGVSPGGSVAPSPATKTPATITWPGFQMRADGTSRVFIQSTTPLEPQPSAAPGKYSLHLPGAHIAGGTNRLPLETRYFNTPVTRVMLTATHEGAELVLDLRADVAPQLSSERGASGYYFTYVDLPKGKFVSEAEKPKPVAPSATPLPTAGPTAPRIKHVRRSSAKPDDLTTYLDTPSASPPAPAANSGNVDPESPPSIKRQSGEIKLGR
jgi:hypothetical protein